MHKSVMCVVSFHSKLYSVFKKGNVNNVPISILKSLDHVIEINLFSILSFIRNIWFNDLLFFKFYIINLLNPQKF